MAITAFASHTARLLRRAFVRTSTSFRAGSALGYDDKEGAGSLTFITVSGVKIATQVRVAETFTERLVGLLKHVSLGQEDGMLFTSSGSIHTLGMRFAIDVLFLDRHMRVLKAASAVRPWRAVFAPSGTEFVLELAAGKIAAAAIGTGMRLLWSETPADQ
jgi:uncharacterized membrane protein (UPF0127 family)